MKAIQITQVGGPEKLTLVDTDRPEPAVGEVLVKIESAGLNFIDTYQREGLYQITLPYILGMEGAGTVEKVGPNVVGFSPGDSVAYAMTAGSYAEFNVVPASTLIRLPKGLTSRQAAAVMLQGMTAHYLAHSTFKLETGHTCLVHAGAGGVGRLLIQIAKQAGAIVYTTVGNDAKAEIARECGADRVILYNEVNFQEEIMRLTDNKGLDVVYDAVAKSTWERSLLSLKERGMLVLYGNASGPAPAIDPLLLNTSGSLFLTRPSLGNYVSTREELEWRASDVFNWVLNGSLKLRTEFDYPLAQAADAHRALEGRVTTGKVLIVP
jgi:NADPH2:quinone reductase